MLINSATSVAADLMNMVGSIGVIAPGAHADIIGLTADPLQNIEVLTRVQDMPLVVKAGQFIRAPKVAA